MAVNHADGTMFVSVVFYPIAAIVGAARAGAGWLALLFIPVGFAVGVLICWFGRKAIYAISGFGLNLTAKIQKGWIQQIAVLPFFLIYLLLPIAIVWGGVFGVYLGSMWL